MTRVGHDFIGDWSVTRISDRPIGAWRPRDLYQVWYRDEYFGTFPTEERAWQEVLALDARARGEVSRGS